MGTTNAFATNQPIFVGDIQDQLDKDAWVEDIEELLKAINDPNDPNDPSAKEILHALLKNEEEYKETGEIIIELAVKSKNSIVRRNARNILADNSLVTIRILDYVEDPNGKKLITKIFFEKLYWIMASYEKQWKSMGHDNKVISALIKKANYELFGIELAPNSTELKIIKDISEKNSRIKKNLFFSAWLKQNQPADNKSTRSRSNSTQSELEQIPLPTEVTATTVDNVMLSVSTSVLAITDKHKGNCKKTEQTKAQAKKSLGQRFKMFMQKFKAWFLRKCGKSGAPPVTNKYSINRGS